MPAAFVNTKILALLDRLCETETVLDYKSHSLFLFPKSLKELCLRIQGHHDMTVKHLNLVRKGSAQLVVCSQCTVFSTADSVTP